MRSLVKSHRIRSLSRAAMVALMASFAGACSSDFTRFDRDLYAEALPQSTQRFRRGASDDNAYPAGVDPTTTASISRGGAVDDGAPVPLGNVNTPVGEPDHRGFQPLSRVRDRVSTVRENRQEARYARQGNSTSNPASSNYEPAGTYDSGVVRSRLPDPRDEPDSMTTGSVRQASAPANPVADRAIPADELNGRSALPPAGPAPDVPQSVSGAPSGEGGWSAAGGTAITLQSGETLYNLSKRYGVPVREIMRANDIANASQVQAGQRIIIPTYVYSRSNGVSAPDNDPGTMAARASTGLVGEVRNGRVGIPEPSPRQMAAVQTDDAGNGSDVDERYRPKPFAVDPERQQNIPDYSITTGSVSGAKSHTVASGDTLSGIARRYGTSVSALQAANGLSGSNIRIGQKLAIPSGGQMASAAPAAASSAAPLIDPVVTGSNTPSETKGPRPYVKPQIDSATSGSVEAAAPERTGIESFRWPVQGRVISGFGDKRGSQTNDGIDISVPEGTAVKATENGVVIYAGNELEGFGNLILVRHEGGFVSAYAHNRSNEVKKGDQVRRGQIIARSGRTGDATVPMLHFELRKDSRPVNPLDHLSG